MVWRVWNTKDRTRTSLAVTRQVIRHSQRWGAMGSDGENGVCGKRPASSQTSTRAALTPAERATYCYISFGIQKTELKSLKRHTLNSNTTHATLWDQGVSNQTDVPLGVLPGKRSRSRFSLERPPALFITSAEQILAPAPRPGCSRANSFQTGKASGRTCRSWSPCRAQGGA